MLSPTFTSGKLKGMLEPIHAIADDTISFMGEKAKTDPVMDFKPIVAGFTLDSISRVAFGIQTKTRRGEDQEFVRMTQSIVETLANGHWSMSLLIHMFNLFPEVFRHLGFWPEASKKILKMTEDVITERDSKNIAVGDFVDRLREFRKNIEPPITKGMIHAQVRKQHNSIQKTLLYFTTSQLHGTLTYTPMILKKSPFSPSGNDISHSWL